MTTANDQNKVSVQYKGIARAKSDQHIEDGFLQEAINVRHKNGKLGPRGYATHVFNVEAGAFSQIWFHDQDGIQNYIGHNQQSGELRLINEDSGQSTLIETLTPGEKVQVHFLKRYMIVVSDSNTRTYLYKDENYIHVSSFKIKSNSIDIKYDRGDLELEITDWSSNAESLKGSFFEKLDTRNKEGGFVTGTISYVVALRLHDGTYVNHTTPRILTIDRSFGVAQSYKQDHGFENDPRQISFSIINNIKAIIEASDFISINNDLYTHLCVFFSKIELQYDFDKLTDEDFKKGVGGYTTYRLSVMLDEMTDSYKALPDADAWYLVHEELMSDIQKKSGTYEIEIDTTGFYQDYATREVLTIDNFTNHSISGKVSYIYNSRLILGSTATSLGSCLTNNSVTGLASSRTGVAKYGSLLFEIALKTSDGDKTVKYVQENQEYYDLSGKKTWYFNSVIGYPDRRAYHMKIYHKTDLTGGKQTKLLDVDLKASEKYNFSYYTSGAHETIEAGFSFITVSYTDPYATAEFVDLTSEGDVIYDENRVQISELNNPLYFPAENSYQVGTGEILAVATNSEPLSQGQFGEYPLIVFTSKGIWTLLQGSGDVLFSNIQPLNGEVATNKDQIVSLSQGVTYSTKEGLFLISGRNVQDITQMLVGRINTDFQTNAQYLFGINNQSTVQLVNNLSTVDAKSYILGANVGFDKDNNELVISNDNYDYSYVMNFDSGAWYKISASYAYFINKYPKLLAVKRYTTLDHVYSLSDEHFEQEVHTLITTSPLKLGAGNTFKLLHRVIQRCEIETKENTFAGFYIFGSNDLRKWQLLQGVDKKSGKITDLFTTRSHVKCKYFIVVLSAQLKEGSSINELDLQHYLKLSNKLR